MPVRPPHHTHGDEPVGGPPLEAAVGDITLAVFTLAIGNQAF